MSLTAANNILDIDWALVVLDERFMAGVDAMAAKRFVQPTLAEEATTAIIDALSANEWQRLNGFAGNSQPSTYAFSVASRAMEDFSRKKFGRPRPPAWLQERGQVWVRLWRMLCLERQWPAVIEQKLALDFKDGLLSAAIRAIKQRIPRCGEPGFAECCVTELGLETLPDDEGESIEVSIQKAQRQRLSDVLALLIENSEAASATVPSNAKAALESLEQCVVLDVDDKLLLSLTYEDGLSSRKVAELMGGSAATVQRRLQALRQQLSEALTHLGLAVTATEGA